MGSTGAVIQDDKKAKAKKGQFWKGIVIGASTVTTLLGGLAIAHEEQEAIVLTQELMYQLDPPSSSVIEVSVFRDFSQSPAFETAEWKEYAELRNSITAENAQEILNETREIQDKVWFPDLKDRLNQLSMLSPNDYQAYYPLSEEEKEEARRIGLNSKEDKTTLYIDIKLSCETQLGIDEDGHISRTDSSGEKGPYLLGDAFITTSEDGTLSAKQKNLLKNGLLPVLEEGKKTFC